MWFSNSNQVERMHVQPKIPFELWKFHGQDLLVQTGGGPLDINGSINPINAESLVELKSLSVEYKNDYH
jgi:hypothetical protein